MYHSFRVMSHHVAVEGNSTAHPNPSPLHQILYLYSQNPHIPGSKSKQVNQVEWENSDKLVCLLGLLHPKCLHVFFNWPFSGGNSLTEPPFCGDLPAGWGPSPWWPPQVPNVAHDASRHNAAVALIDKGKPKPGFQGKPGNDHGEKRDFFPKNQSSTMETWQPGIGDSELRKPSFLGSMLNLGRGIPRFLD